MITARFFQLFTGVCATAASCHPQPAEPRYQRVVLVHGILEDGKAFDSLKNRLETHGIDCFVPRLKPNTGSCGLDTLAEKLKSEIDEKFGPDDSIAIVGFSMGGLVSRYYLQKLDGAKRCETFITISSPHHGTKAARIFPGKGAFQMRPGSDSFENSTKAMTHSALFRSFPTAHLWISSFYLLIPPSGI